MWYASFWQVIYLLNSTVAAKSSLQFENNLFLDPDYGGKMKQKCKLIPWLAKNTLRTRLLNT
jgi:hypothetical protein